MLGFIKRGQVWTLWEWRLVVEGAIVIEGKVSRKGHIQGRMPLDHN